MVDRGPLAMSHGRNDHISLVEGHLKMIDMVRKHTVEGTNNHRIISELIDRSKDMLFQAKSTACTFVPPPNQLEQVPLGSSSDTMYPGYSPGHFDYGKAAEEFGRYASETKRQGKETKPEGIDYESGQPKRFGHLTLAQIRDAKGTKGGTGSGTESRGAAGLSEPTAAMSNAQTSGGDETQKAGEQMFFMDSKPTPVNFSGAKSSAKRKATPERAAANISKKQKKQHGRSEVSSDEAAEEPAEPVNIEFEDISREVDARLKEKEERPKLKQRAKEVKKRKRESEGSSAVITEGPQATDPLRPKRKKIKKVDNSGEVPGGSLKKRSALDDEEGAVGSSNAVTAEKPRKKSKVSQITNQEKMKKHQLGKTGAGNENPKKRKPKIFDGKITEKMKKNRIADGEPTLEIAEVEGKTMKKRKTNA
ncbi:MAG: hypothetical protein Q9216_004412 [Gyalolechia sp. 2 TL-2023]